MDETLIFIKEIKQRPELWNNYDNNYHNREITDKIWNELAEKYSVSVEHLKTRWISLRSQFRKSYLRQIISYKTNPNKKIVNSWKYFVPLLFLRSHLKKYKSKAFCQLADLPLECDEEIFDKINNEFDVMEADYEESATVNDTIEKGAQQLPNTVNCDLYDPISSSVLNNLLESFQKDIVALEKEKDATIDESQTDEDLLFLHSILPYMKSLSLTKKLILRTKIQSLVCNFIMDLDSNYFDAVAACTKEKKSYADVNSGTENILTTNITTEIMAEKNLENVQVEPTESNDETDQNALFNDECFDFGEGISLKRLKDDSCIWLLNVND